MEREKKNMKKRMKGLGCEGKRRAEEEKEGMGRKKMGKEKKNEGKRGRQVKACV